MPAYHPQLIARARREVVTHVPGVPEQRQRVARVIQWIILRDSRPQAVAPEGKLVRVPLSIFEGGCRPRRLPCPASHLPGGAA